ncbi:50S ribosomal protein L25, partial [bacterium]
RLHVPIRIVGEAPGVKAGGVLNVLFDTVRVHGLPKDIPSIIELDVSNLEMGEAIRVRDVDFGNVEPLLPPERALVTVVAPRGLEEAAIGGPIEEGGEAAAEAEEEAPEASQEGESE